MALAVWLVSDNYDYQTIPNYISATTLLKPLRQSILSSRTLLGAEEKETDLSELAAKSMGNALHDSIEKAWLENHEKSLALLGYPEDVIKRILINPTPEQLAKVSNPIPVYMEQRHFRKVGNWTVGGKFDMVADGVVHDNKSTTVYAWINGGKDEDYQLQGSIYRWLCPHIITEDFIRINFIFTDWQRSKAAQDPNYPQSRVLCKEIPLLSVEETDEWVKHKLGEYDKYFNAADSAIPFCTDKELWKAETQYKYYANPENTARATKVFGTDMTAAHKYWKGEKGGKGIVIAIEGEPKRCNYCDAIGHCSQARKYFS